MSERIYFLGAWRQAREFAKKYDFEMRKFLRLNETQIMGLHRVHVIAFDGWYYGFTKEQEDAIRQYVASHELRLITPGEYMA